MEENDYSAVEVPKPKKESNYSKEREAREPKEKPSRPEIDIDQILSKPKPKMEDEIFEEDG